MTILILLAQTLEVLLFLFVATKHGLSKQFYRLLAMPPLMKPALRLRFQAMGILQLLEDPVGPL
jgi:hypothetical protein